MRTILILGAGLSASSLLRYLLAHSDRYDWKLRVVDVDQVALKRKLNDHPNATALSFDALDRAQRLPEIKQADLVISMLPAIYHPEVAEDCISLKKDLITPSYVSPRMRELDQAAREAGIIIMNEIGVDPGIDHMSAMKIIDEVKSHGGRITSFKSFCGGLIAPESDDNPWNYKFTWNPRNVVLAGQGGTASFIKKGEYKYIPYVRLFERLDHYHIDGFGDFVGYANRDSLSYREVYGLNEIPTIYRGTFRRPGFCEAWNVFVQLGMTDDSFNMLGTESMSPRQYLNAFLPYDPKLSVEEKFKSYLGKERMQLFHHFEWLGLFESEQTIHLPNSSPAQVLQHILVPKLRLNEGDKDMLVMLHEFEYEIGGISYYHTSSMVNIGEDATYTSMSNTVGIPVAICAKMILNGQIQDRGVHIPVQKHIYEPILDELASFGIKFSEVKKEL